MILSNNQFGRLELLMEELHSLVDGELTESRALDFAVRASELFSAKELNTITGDMKCVYNSNKPVTITTEV
jgi:hypothetical protein